MRAWLSCRRCNRRVVFCDLLESRAEVMQVLALACRLGGCAGDWWWEDEDGVLEEAS